MSMTGSPTEKDVWCLEVGVSVGSMQRGGAVSAWGETFPKAWLKAWIKSYLMPDPPSHSGNASQKYTYCLAKIQLELRLCH